uniref:Patatin-like phospholipase domain-containing protein 3 n=1 Tax=Sus scrofa TaxID=9823 RepID=A0A480H9F7_PIG
MYPSGFLAASLSASMSLGDRIRMCSSQGRMLRRRWSSSSSPSGLASQAATPGEESGLKGSQGGSKTSHSAKDTFRPGWGLSQMPTKGTETDPSGDFRQRPHCPPAQVEGSKQDWEAAGLLSAPGRDRPGQAPHWEKEGWGFEAGQM